MCAMLLMRAPRHPIDCLFKKLKRILCASVSKHFGGVQFHYNRSQNALRMPPIRSLGTLHKKCRFLVKLRMFFCLANLDAIFIKFSEPTRFNSNALEGLL